MPATKTNKNQQLEPTNPNTDAVASTTESERQYTKEELLASINKELRLRDETIAKLKGDISLLLRERAELASQLSRANSALKLLASNSEAASNIIAETYETDYSHYNKSIAQEKRNENIK